MSNGVAPKSMAWNWQTLVFFSFAAKREARVKLKVNFRSIFNIHQYQHFESMTSKILIDFGSWCNFRSKKFMVYRWKLWLLLCTLSGPKSKYTHTHNRAHCVIHYSWHNFGGVQILLALEWKHLNNVENCRCIVLTTKHYKYRTTA